MKYLIVVLLLFTTYRYGYSHSLVVDKSKTTQANKKELTTLHKIDSISKSIESKETLLNHKIDDASQTIGYLNSIINSFGQIFTILGIFIGIIALALPIIMYQFGIKPSQRALKDLEANIDSLLGNYLKKARDKEIDNAISSIKSGTVEQKNKAISYLALTQHEGFTDNQLYKIYSILNRNRNETNIKSQLAFILSSQKSDYAEDFFNEDDIKKDPIIKQMAFLYFTKTGFKNHYSTLTTVINESENQYQDFSTFLFNLSQYSFSDVIELFNDNTFIDNLSVVSLPEMKNDFKITLESLNIPDEIFKNTYLYTKIHNDVTATG